MTLVKIGLFLILTGVLSPAQFLSAQHIDSLAFEQFTHIFSKIAHEASPSVVKIAAMRSINDSTKGQKRQVAYGSGCLISPNGHILTCNHVIAGATNVSIYFDSQEIEATLIWFDPNVDIAILKIDGFNLPHLILGDSDTAEVGEWIVSIGYPFSLYPFVARGIIGAKDDQGKVLLLDILTCPGNSGGSLLNLKGEIIGVCSALYHFNNELNGAAVAIPINLVRNKILEQVQKT